ncbi:MAG: hypothetical protein AB1480_09695 [Nitrospirota bacterium]
MAKGHSKKIAKTKKPTKETAQKPKKLPEEKQTSLQTILTATSVEKKFDEMNIQQVNPEELFKDDKFLKDLSGEESIEEMSLKDEYGEIEDEDIEFDEPSRPDTFDIEDRDKIRRSKYIIEIFIENNNINAHSAHAPMFDTSDNLINGTMIRRYNIFKEMAYFIAEKQKGFFINPDLKYLNPLNQKDLVMYLQSKKYVLEKGHISRMLDALYFRIKGRGDLPAKHLFKRYGHKTRLSKDDMLTFAVRFLDIYNEKASQLDRAKRFHEYLKEEKNIEIPLSDSLKENDKYKYLKNILKEAAKIYEKTKG